MTLILPKRVAALPLKPLFFLAGPTTGADDWQYAAYRQLEEYYGSDHFVAALPCRYGPDHPLRAKEITGYGDATERQQAWEDHYLELAGFPPDRGGATWGCVLFWIPVQQHDRPPETGPYARDTRREAGRWSAFLQMEPRTRVVFGADPSLWHNKAFGLSQMTRNFDRAHEKNALGPFMVHDTLEGTVRAAIQTARY